MSIYLNTYYKNHSVGLANYLKVLFSTFRINSIINPGEITPCVDKDFEWVFKSIYTNDEYIYSDIIEECPWCTIDNWSIFQNNAIYHMDGRKNFFTKEDTTPIYKTNGWRFYTQPSDNVNSKPFANEWDIRDQTSSIDLRYTNIPKNMIDVYTNIIKKFNIQESITNHINTLKDKIGGDFLGVHIRTWVTRHDITNNSVSKDRYNWYLNQRNNIINSINKNPNKKVLICSDNIDEVKLLLPYIKDKEIFYYEKNTELSDLQNDFAELLLLSKSNYLIGSNNSTFSELAWWYADCKIGVEIY